MEQENIDWDNVDSVFIVDDQYEDFDAPKWVDLSASDELVDDEAWFCNHVCKHPKTAEDFRKTRSNSKAKLKRFVTISEILPFRDRNRRENSSVAGSSYAKLEKSRVPNSSRSFDEDSENKNPNFSAPVPNGRTNKLKEPTTKPNSDNANHLDGSMENAVKSGKKWHLKSTFSARDLLGGRQIMNQMTEFCSELKKLARKGSKKGNAEKASSRVLEERKKTLAEREEMSPLVVKEEKTLNNGIVCDGRN